MAKFSFGRDDNSNDGESSNPKRRRVTQPDTTEQLHREAVVEEEEESEQEQSSDDDVVMVSDVGEDEGCHVFTLTDPDVLDCPVCFDPLTIPVFQCDNGHITCSSCSPKVSNKCPSCALPIGYSRCRAIEKVIESIKISCRNFKYGCIEKTSYCNKNEHENTCGHTPCSCPHLDCTFIGSLKQLSAHFTIKHVEISRLFRFDVTFKVTFSANEKYTILREKGGRLFILNIREFQSLGSVLSVSCIQPNTSKELFSYYMVAKKDESVLKFESIALNVTGRAENPEQRRFLMVPWDFVDAYDRKTVEINISNQP